MQIIAHIKTDFIEKFGLPRQSGVIKELTGKIVFEPEFRSKEAFRGIEEYSHIWILWKFSKAQRKNWSATVKPPKLGGNKRMGVFATRSPYRPNDIGLSCVKLEKLEFDEKLGPVLYVSGIDMINDTPIYDIKPYLAYTDSRPDAICGFADSVEDYELEVVFSQELLDLLPLSKQKAAIELLKQDPRPGYQNDPTRKYGVTFAGYDIRFYVESQILTVCEVEKLA